jgi:hypothetical protein
MLFACFLGCECQPGPISSAVKSYHAILLRTYDQDIRFVQYVGPGSCWTASLLVVSYWLDLVALVLRLGGCRKRVFPLCRPGIAGLSRFS